MITHTHPSPVSVLGIDPSTVATGWAVMSAAGHLLASGTIRPAGDIETRILATAWECGQLYAKHRPTSVYCEEQVLSRIPRPKKLPQALAGLVAAHQMLKEDAVSNVKTALDLRGLSRAIGFSVHICSARMLQVVYLRPTSWRMAFNCAKASKAVALHQVKLLMRSRGIRFERFSEDEVEAWGIAESGRLLMLQDRLIRRAG